MKNSKKIFQQGSKTFYTASLFFPEDVRENVTRLYAFVRIADDYVDKNPQDKKGFLKFKKETKNAFANGKATNKVIQDFVKLCHTFAIEEIWVNAFLSAMEQDLSKKKYSTYSELEEYMYGSAEVIGLMMSRILQLPKTAERSARLQGKAMQLINFIRDIDEDLDLGRQYIPQNDLNKFGIAFLSDKVDEDALKKLVAFEIRRYTKLQKEAKEGYRHIPRKNRIPIATAAALYTWTAQEILRNPTNIFKQKIKPSKVRIFIEFMKQSFMT